MALAGFDAVYYTQQNADVRAAVQAGVFASAEEHFLKYGQFENRNPNAYFDTTYYLTSNQDVLNALSAKKITSAYAHYLAYGATEGRVPSSAFAGFDGATYLAANADVAAAGYTAANAISHYVLYGAAEHRSGANVGVIGQTLALTTGIDLVTGTANDDSIIGSVAGTVTLTAGDQINGGAGTDTLKVYGAGALPTGITLTSIEKIYLNGTNAGADISSYTSVTSLEVDTPAAGYTFTVGANQAVALTNIGAVTTTIAGNTPTSQTLTVNKLATGGTVDLSGTALTTLNLIGSTAASTFTLTNTGAKLATLNVSGSQNLTITESLNGLKTINASTATGAVNVDASGATIASTFAFTGGSGNDTIKFADNALGTTSFVGSQLDGGAGTADKIGLLDTALTAAEYTALAAAKNFEVIGLNAAITVDASQISAYKVYSLDTNAAQIINKTVAGTTVNVTAAHAAAITVAADVGVTDLAFTVGTSSTGGLAIGGNTTLSGQTAITLTSNGTNAAANTINNLVLTDNAVVTVKGSNDLTITAIGTTTTTGHKIDGSAMTGKLNVTANTTAYSAGSSLGDILIGGSGADTLKAGLNSGKLTGNGGADTFDVSVAVAGGTANANITLITDFTKGDKITFGGTAGAFTTAKIDLSGAASEQAAIDLLVAGNNSDVKWGVYNGNTYVADDVGAGATMAATDTIVKLTGTLDLSTSTFATNTLTFA